MAPYSMDLRKRVFKAFEASGDAEEVAATFGVSRPLTRFTSASGSVLYPSWWPRGNRIAFQHGTTESSIWTVRVP